MKNKKFGRSAKTLVSILGIATASFIFLQNTHKDQLSLSELIKSHPRLKLPQIEVTQSGNINQASAKTNEQDFVGNRLENDLRLIADLSLRPLNNAFEVDALTRLWAKSLDTNDVIELQNAVLSGSVSPDLRLTALFVIGESGHEKSEAVLLRTLENVVPPAVRTGKNQSIEFQIQSLAIDLLPKVGSSASLSTLGELNKKTTDATTKMQTAMAIQSLLSEDTDYSIRQQNELLKKTISKLRKPSQNNPVQVGLSKVKDQADVADMGDDLRKRFEADLGINYKTFSAQRDDLSTTADSRRVNNALAFLKFIEFENQPEGLVQENYYDFINDRINAVIRSSGAKQPNVLAQASVFTDSTALKFRPSQMEIFDAGVNRGLFELMGTLVHEARHIQGFHHVDCKNDTRKNACDPNFAFGGSWAVAAEFGARVALFSTNSSQFIKTIARLYAIELAVANLNTPALSPEKSLIVQTENSFFLASSGGLEELAARPKAKHFYTSALTGLIETNPAQGESQKPSFIDPLLGVLLDPKDEASFNSLGKLGFMTQSDLLDLKSSEISENIFAGAVATDDLLQETDLTRAVCKTDGTCVFNIQSQTKNFRGNWKVNFGKLKIRSVRMEIDEKLSDLDRFFAEVHSDDLDNEHFRVTGLFNSSVKMDIKQLSGNGSLGDERRVYFGSAKFKLQSNGRLVQESAGQEDKSILNDLQLKLEPIQGLILNVHEFDFWNVRILSKD
jgi:hypothetical protein